MNEPQPNRTRHPLERTPEEYAAYQAQRTPPPSVALRLPRGRPFVTYALIAINVLIFAAGALITGLDAQLLDFGAVSHDAILCQTYYDDPRGGCVPEDAPATRRNTAAGGQFYRLFTAMFLHASLLHIFFNMYALYLFGSFIEWIYGHWRFLLLYLLGGLAGSLLSAIFSQPFSRSVGASGAIIAIFSANIVFLYRQRGILGQAARGQLTQLLFIAGLNLIIGFTPGSAVDNWGHIGGMIGGALLAWLINPTLIVQETREMDDGRQVHLVNRISYARLTYTLFALYAVGLALILIAAFFINRGGG